MNFYGFATDLQWKNPLQNCDFLVVNNFLKINIQLQIENKKEYIDYIT